VPFVKPDAIVVGAGAVGLFSAWSLRRAGLQVLLIERAGVPAEASWAGGGILMPLEPHEHPPALDDLLRQSRNAYPGLMTQLIRNTGVDPEYSACGALVSGLAVDAVLEWARRTGEPAEILDRAAVARREPELRVDGERTARLPQAAQVRNPRLLKALVAQLGQSGVELRFSTPVTGLETLDGKRVAVRTATGSFSAAAVVVAAGAWSASLLAPLGVELPVRPVKGQMLLLRPARARLRHIVLGNDAYLVPRRDGRVLVGSTLEEAGFDKTPTSEAEIRLRQSASGLVPALAEAALERHWAGLRPGSADGLPHIGRMPGFDNLFVNAGHYRLGLTLAPASAELLACQVLDRKPELDPAPFRALRL
jgi:glycine oxidase